MALDDELIVAELTPFPDGTCWTTPQEFADLLVSHLVLVFNNTAGNSFYNFGTGPISADNQVYPWLKTDAVTGMPLGWYIYVSGAWQQVPGYPIYFTDVGPVNAIQITTGDALTVNTQLIGRLFVVKLANAVTGATTVAVDTIPPIPLHKNVTENLAGGDTRIGQLLPFVYDSVTNTFKLLWPLQAPKPYVSERTPAQMAETATALSGADTVVASINTLTLPAGMNWRWIKVHFSTLLLNAQSIGPYKVFVGAVGAPALMSWAQSPRVGVLAYAAGAATTQNCFVAEGVPLGAQATTPLQVDITAQWDPAVPIGDNVTDRSAYVVAEYGPV